MPLGKTQWRITSPVQSPTLPGPRPAPCPWTPTMGKFPDLCFSVFNLYEIAEKPLLLCGVCSSTLGVLRCRDAGSGNITSYRVPRVPLLSDVVFSSFVVQSNACPMLVSFILRSTNPMKEHGHGVCRECDEKHVEKDLLFISFSYRRIPHVVQHNLKHHHTFFFFFLTKCVN